MPTTSVSKADFAYIQQMVREYAGWVLEGEKQYLVETRLSPLVAQAGLGSIAELLAVLRANSGTGLHRAMMEAMLIGETMFFRDPACFDALRDVVLPRLIERRGAERRLQIWCAACSTGQEPYSIAMFIEEMFPQLADWTVSILATDLSKTHLERAREGRYAQLEVNRGLPASLLVKYFDQEGIDWIINPVARRRVEFREFNLVRPWSWIPPVDLLLLRNVMIYWDEDMKREVLGRVRQVIRPDGCLVLGTAETTHCIDEGFERLSAGAACCFRVTR